jgi:DNA-binding MltR family transcriptional regulator
MKLCYLLGLIAKEDMDDLKLINRIRNHFAHNIMINSFDEEDIAKDCNNLKRISMLKVIDRKTLSPRIKYLNSSLAYIAIFTLTLFGVGKERIVRAKPWFLTPINDNMILDSL